MMNADMPAVQAPVIVLASQSPRRRELLGRLGISSFIAVSPDADESQPPGLPPGPLVEQLSLRKAVAVAAPEGAIVIAADTLVVLGGQILGKPENEASAARMLAALSGKTHLVYTGVTVLRGGRRLTGHEVTGVTFRALTATQIDHYIATGEPMDKAGAYGIQGLGASLVTRLEGDYYNVMGLPAARLSDMLAEFGVDLLAMAATRDV